MYSIHHFVDYLSNYLGVLLKNVKVDVYQNQNGKQESTFETLKVISYSTFMYNSPRIQGQMDTLPYKAIVLLWGVYLSLNDVGMATKM